MCVEVNQGLSPTRLSRYLGVPPASIRSQGAQPVGFDRGPAKIGILPCSTNDGVGIRSLIAALFNPLRTTRNSPYVLTWTHVSQESQVRAWSTGPHQSPCSRISSRFRRYDRDHWRRRNLGSSLLQRRVLCDCPHDHGRLRHAETARELPGRSSTGHATLGELKTQLAHGNSTVPGGIG